MRAIQPKYLIIEDMGTNGICVAEVSEDYATMQHALGVLVYRGYRRINGIVYYYYYLPPPIVSP